MFRRLNMLIGTLRRGVSHMQPTPLSAPDCDVEFVATINGRQQVLTDNLVIVSLYPLRFACGFAHSEDIKIPKDILVQILDKLLKDAAQLAHGNGRRLWVKKWGRMA